MKKSLLATAAAIAVMTVSGPAWAQRQEAPAGRTEQPQRPPAAQQNAPAEKIAPAGPVAPSRSGNDVQQGAQAPADQSRGQSTTGQGGASGGQMERERDGARPEGRTGNDQQRTSPQRGERGNDMQQRSEESQPGQRQQPRAQQERNGGNTAAQNQRSGSGSVSLTTEQKTKIRSTVLTSNAPRVTNINFSVNVGTVVPRTVRIVAVPPTLIEIHPEWRGYMYFVHGDEIIVVEPDSLRIVAVLAV